MEVTLFMAISLNGIIARESGSEDFLSDYNWSTFSQLAQETGCFVVGKSTFEKVQQWTDFNFDSINCNIKMVVSSDKDLVLPKGYIHVTSPTQAIKKAEEAGYNHLLLSGGSKLNTSFLKEKLVNKIIFNIEPVVIGKGIPVIYFDTFSDVTLSNPKSKFVTPEIIQVTYTVT